MGRLRFVRARGSPPSRTLLSRTACPIAYHPSPITHPSPIGHHLPTLAARTGGRRSGPAAARAWHAPRRALRPSQARVAQLGSVAAEPIKGTNRGRTATFLNVFGAGLNGRDCWQCGSGWLSRAGVVLAWSRHHGGANAVKRVRLESPCRRHSSATDLVRVGARGMRDRKLGRGKSELPARRSGSAFRNGRT
jgi:hypothetical protein